MKGPSAPQKIFVNYVLDRGCDGCQDIGIVVNGEQHVTLTIIIKAATEKTVTSVEEAHKISTSVQDSIMKEIGAARVVVHTEPF